MGINSGFKGLTIHGLSITKNILFSPYPLKQTVENAHPPVQWAPRLFVGGERPERGVHNPPPIQRRG